MKSSFGRSFFPAILVLLMALCSIGLFFQFLAKSVMEDRAIDRLKTEADTVAQLAAAYYQTSPEETDDFLLNLSIAARVSDADTVICDTTGKLLICSENPLGCQHRGLQIAADYLNDVKSKDYVVNTGMVAGLYADARYVVSVPIKSGNSQILGIVMATSPVSQTNAILRAMTNIYLGSAIVAAVLAVLIMIFVARHHSRPLKNLKKAAVAFGHGDLTARVALEPGHPEEVRELALAFNNMAESLQKMEYSRQEFVANVSHELKTPMTTIAGFADGILDGTIPQERQAHYLKMISSETKRLNRLVRSMLDTTRLQENQQIPESQKTRFDVSECAGQVLLGFEQKITGKDLDVQVKLPDRPVYTRANQDHIIQVIYNLVDNAVKFCPREGTLWLTVRAGGNKIYVSVANTGQTIPPEELPLVFDRFHKLDKSRSENRDSWGLGLYIVKTIICAHGEDISVASHDDKTEFTFTLPLVN